MSVVRTDSLMDNVQMEAIEACPACSSMDSSFLYKSRDWLYELPGEFELSGCSNCGVIYLSKRPTAENIGFYYPNDTYYSYRRPASYSLFWRKDVVSSIWYFIKKSILTHQYGYKHMGGNKLVSTMARAPFLRPLHQRACFQLDILLHPYVENGNLLEIGCGSGMYLDLMRALGWKRVVGVDIGDEAIRQVKERLGIEAYCEDLRSIRFEPASFDAVSMSHTLEHVYNPVEFLTEIRHILKPNGRLAIIVPNVQALSSQKLQENWFGIDSPRHLVHFTTGGLSKLLERAGFKIQSLKTVPRAAYMMTLFSYSRKAMENNSAYKDPHYHFPINRRAKAYMLSLFEHVQCGFGLPSGEEIYTVAVK